MEQGENNRKGRLRGNTAGGGRAKRKVWGNIVLAAACAGVLAAAGRQMAGQVHLQRELSQNVLRFHVRANSNETADQVLKYQVRDAVAACLQEKLADADSLEAARRVAADSLGELENVARRTLEENGCSEPVAAKLDREWFPQKTYGSVCFPQGNYEALVVEIGAGAGRNWWCVMYPNICFSGTVYAAEENGEKLKKVLDEEEYRQVIVNKDYKVGFQGLNNLAEKVKIRH